MTDLTSLRKVAEAATKGPWTSRGMGGDSIVLAPTHRWHQPYAIPSHGYPIAVPRTYQDRASDGESLETKVDYSSAGFAHCDAAFLATFNPALVTKLLAELEAARALRFWAARIDTMCHGDSFDRFEAVASMFYNDTGMLRPGKDAGAASGQPERGERSAAFDVWWAKQFTSFHDALAAYAATTTEDTRHADG